MHVLQRPMISTIVSGVTALGDPTMDNSNIGDFSTGQSYQPTMLENTRELLSSLVEMMISSRDLSMKEAAASQRGDAQVSSGDGTDALNEDLVNVDPKDVKGS